MSASREKKQRQGAGPDQKNVKVQQEQAARKRQTVIYSVVGAVIAVLVVALLVWRSGFFQARATAASVGGEDLTAAELSYYYHSVRNSFLSTNSYYLSIIGFDTSKADDEQYYSESDSQTYRDYFMETALTNAQRHLALSKAAVDAGHTEAEIKDDLDAEIAEVKSYASSYGYSYGAYLKAMYGDYMTASVFEKLTTRYLMAALVVNEEYDELFDGYSQADLDAYYQEHADDLDTIEFSALYFSIPSVDTKDEDGNELAEDEVEKLTEEAQAETRAKAEEALEAVENGSTFQSQIDKYDLTSSLSVDHSTRVGTANLNSSYSEDLLKLSKDECDLVETDNGYYVISFHDRYLDQEPTRDVRHILARAETTTDDDNNVVAPTDEAWAAAKAKMDEIQAAWDASDKSESAFADLANEKSDDGDGTTGGLYTNASNGGFVTEFNDWVFDSSRQPGDVDMVQHNEEGGSYYGYHLIYYVGENEPVWMTTARDAMADEAQESWIQGLTEPYPTSLTSGADSIGR